MQKAFAQFGSRTATSNHGVSTARNIQYHAYHMPVIALAFLLVIIVSIVAARAIQSVQRDNTPVTQALTNTPKEEGAQSEALVAAEPQASSVTTEAKVENGQASVSMTVNGQEVSIPQQGSTHQTISNNGATTTIDVQTNSVQSGNTNQSSFTHNNTSSFSTSFQSVTGNSSQ